MRTVLCFIVPLLGLSLSQKMTAGPPTESIMRCGEAGGIWPVLSVCAEDGVVKTFIETRPFSLNFLGIVHKLATDLGISHNNDVRNAIVRVDIAIPVKSCERNGKLIRCEESEVNLIFTTLKGEKFVFRPRRIILATENEGETIHNSGYTPSSSSHDVLRLAIWTKDTESEVSDALLELAE